MPRQQRISSISDGQQMLGGEIAPTACCMPASWHRARL